ncbi:thiamine pyrophosphate-dependent enzyme [Arthrobacter castelli]|uniref:thiamine pyrophosphate-dependent enzyme n=1 Tax=Arthrobacter castelli TaxID=271431 RepID=UPI00041B6DBF|nr:thiamine pyrophosphate-dependent enzyme [Arthrobacter castelli]
MTTTVREASLQVLRDRGLTTMFANPGSTEVPFLSGLPDDFHFVLALHEGSVIGMATGYALAQGKPALALVHTTAGLGNAVGAIATARVNRAPMVIVVGQQDRRHLALEPFLAGKLESLAGDYPLQVFSPARAADVPSALGRAALTAEQDSGPALVIVPMSDWTEPAEADADAAAARVSVSPSSPPAELAQVAEALANAKAPAIMAGSGNDTEAGWAALTTLAEELQIPVWIEPFGSRAGFDQAHPLYRGQLPADRPRLREALSECDLLLVVGTAAIRQYPYTTGPLVPGHTRVFVLTGDPVQANRSPAELAVVGDPATLCTALREQLPRTAVKRGPVDPATSPARDAAAAHRLPEPADGEPLRAAHVFQLLAGLLPEETILVEESPSSRPALQALVPARRPLGFLSAAMGGLGFAMPAAIGLKMGAPQRPVVAVVGDGSSMYSIQSLWSAAQLNVGVVFIVLANGGYAVMDRLAEQRDSKPAWPGFPQISVSTIASGFGVAARRVDNHAELSEVLADAIGNAASSTEPLLLEVAVAPDTSFAP